MIIRDNQGQATTEYILLLAIVLGLYLLVTKGLSNINMNQKIMNLFTGSFSAAYQFGHTQAKGYNNGGPQYHPRAVGGNNNFRIFLNPKTIQ